MRHWLKRLFGTVTESDNGTPVQCSLDRAIIRSRSERTTDPSVEGDDRLYYVVYDRVQLVCPDCGWSVGATDLSTKRRVYTDDTPSEDIDNPHDGRFELHVPWEINGEPTVIDPQIVEWEE